jgi:hypothetical protein
VLCNRELGCPQIKQVAWPSEVAVSNSYWNPRCAIRIGRSCALRIAFMTTGGTFNSFGISHDIALEADVLIEPTSSQVRCKHIESQLCESVVPRPILNV